MDRLQTLSLDDFVDDQPWGDDIPLLEDVPNGDLIAGVRIQRLTTRADKRGDLTVLMSSLLQPVVPPPHVYLVSAEPGSIRAWVYHKRQFDRLAYTNGEIRVVLYDLRTDSPTYRKLDVFDFGSANRALLTIPPYVVHGVQNRGKSTATFVNMPTNVYDPENPDKSRIRFDHPGIPYRFE